MWSWLSVALSGFISVNAIQDNKNGQAMMFKTLSLLLLLAILYSQNQALTPASAWVGVGLVVSIFADILYQLKRYKRLCFASFITAQICFSKSFWLQLSTEMVWWLPAMLLASSVVMFFLLLPQIDRLIFPVAVMGLVLVQFAWAAGELWLLHQDAPSLAGFLGAISLSVSAGLLAIHDYRRAIWAGRYLISGTYLLALSLITASVAL
ncbi:lysoplasmalogenase [Vibrio paucivorans]